MLGSLLVFGCLVLALVIALTLYKNNRILNFLLIGLLFVWSSFSYFLAFNYVGWPSSQIYPLSRIISIEIIEPIGDDDGKIFIWVYHIDDSGKKFYEYDLQNTPRSYIIPYTDKSGQAFRKAAELLSDGYEVHIGGENKQQNGNSENKKQNEIEGLPGDENYDIEYDVSMPPINAINPRAAIPKE